MLRKSPAPPPHTKTLDEQQSDFTAEGSPPPGKVGNNLPAADVPVTSTTNPDAMDRSHLDGTLPHENIAAGRKPRPVSAPTVKAAKDSADPGVPCTVPDAPLQKVYRDAKHGPTDTHRGSGTDRTDRQPKE